MILLVNKKKADIKRIIRGVFLSFIFLFLIGVFYLEINLFFTNSELSENNISGNNLEVSASSITGIKAKTVEVKPEKSFDLDAESALSLKIWPNQNDILLKKNEKEKLPIASLVKLMTALLVLEKYDLSQRVVISQSAMAQEGEQGNLKLGEVLSVKNLLYITLIESSNRAAYALSESLPPTNFNIKSGGETQSTEELKLVGGEGTDKFISLMNERAQELGLLNTYFEDSTGLSPQSYSTAEDVAKLSEYLFLNYPLFGEITGLKEFNLYLSDGSLHHKLLNTNKILGEDNIIGEKLVGRDVAQGCFMVIQKNPESSGYFIHVILGSKDRFGEMKKLINVVQ